MPRLGRLHVTGGYYHVIGRGIERRTIFGETADKEDFLKRLDDTLDRAQAQCLAWAVMSNHYHLLIRVGVDPLSKLMASLLGGYAGGYNRRHHRTGYVFQNRYKSILCDAESYLLELVRYIHLNPVKAKVVKSLSDLDFYRWTGHATLLGNHQQSWQEIDAILCLFGKQSKIARIKYRQFIEEGIRTISVTNLSGGGLIRSYGGWEAASSARKEHLLRIGDERILGDSDFVELALREDDIRLQRKTMRQQQNVDLQELINRVCNHFHIDQRNLKRKGRSNELSTARALICFWGVHELGLTTTQLAGRLGISQPAVSKSSKRGEDYCRENTFEIDDLE